MIYDDFFNQLGKRICICMYMYINDSCFSIPKSRDWEDAQYQDFGIENKAGIPRLQSLLTRERRLYERFLSQL